MRRTKEEALHTREALLDAAETLFSRQGVSRTSLQQIADHGAQPRLQRIDMADHRCMVNAQDFRRARHRPHSRHLKGGADLIPILKAHSVCTCEQIQCDYGGCVFLCNSHFSRDKVSPI